MVLSELGTKITGAFRKLNTAPIIDDELLDEVLDYGYPQNCSTDVLKLYITQQSDKTAATQKRESFRYDSSA